MKDLTLILLLFVTGCTSKPTSAWTRMDNARKVLYAVDSYGAPDKVLLHRAEDNFYKAEEALLKERILAIK